MSSWARGPEGGISSELIEHFLVLLVCIGGFAVHPFIYGLLLIHLSISVGAGAAMLRVSARHELLVMPAAAGKKAPPVSACST